MIVDLNAHIGHYPFRRLRHNSPEGLIALMDRWGTDRVVVSNLDSLIYRNTAAGNSDLATAVKSGNGRLIGVATIDPTYAGWEADLERALDEWGFKAVRLMPNYHHYDLEDRATGRLLRKLADRDVPVVFHQSFEDSRQKHLWDQSGELSLNQIVSVASAFDGLRVIYLNGQSLGEGRELAREGRLLMCWSRMKALLMPEIQKTIEAAGNRAIAFGTGIPLYDPATSLLKLEVAGLSPEDRERISWRNTTEFLKL